MLVALGFYMPLQLVDFGFYMTLTLFYASKFDGVVSFSLSKVFFFSNTFITSGKPQSEVKTYKNKEKFTSVD